MKHKELHPLLWDYLLGQTSPEQTRSIQDHLLQCTDCQMALEELRSLEDSLSSLRSVQAGDQFNDRVFEKIAGDHPFFVPQTADVRLNWAVITRRLAAVVLIGIVTGVLLIRFSAFAHPLNQDNGQISASLSYESMFGEDEMLAFENYITDQNPDAYENPGE